MTARGASIYEEAWPQAGSFETTPIWEEDVTRLPPLTPRCTRRMMGGSAWSQSVWHSGVAEVGIYVAAARAAGRWSRYSADRECGGAGQPDAQAATMPAPSLELQRRCGFRVVGRRERIAKRDGRWHDTVLTERRSKKVGID